MKQEINNFFNYPIDFDESLLDVVSNDPQGVLFTAELIQNSSKNLTEKKDDINAALIGCRCMDLTSLNGNDTDNIIKKLCARAINPVRKNILNELISKNLIKEKDINLTTAAVCFYPNFLRGIKRNNPLEVSENKDVKIAVVSTGFPTNQLQSIEGQIAEIKEAVANGTDEIDVVINRSLALNEEWNTLYNNLCKMRLACTDVKFKVILEVGELLNYDLIYKASMVAMMAGADFIKTSTGKTSINATIPFGIVMARAIKLFELSKGIKVGLKAAGGIRNLNDVKSWICLVNFYLGEDWVNPTYFRIGASSLLKQLETDLYKLAFDKDPTDKDLSY